MSEVAEVFSRLKVGDKIRFNPAGSGVRAWWEVRAIDRRFLLATAQAPFKPKGENAYTVLDLTGWKHTYNGVRPGVVRSSLNSIGGGWDTSTEESIQEAMDGLNSGAWELSNRRVIEVDEILVKP